MAKYDLIKRAVSDESSFRDDDVQAFPYYRLFSQEVLPKMPVGLDKRNPPLLIGKKYDR